MADQLAGASYDVFLSHNSKDKPAVIALAERLRAQGLQVWLDVWELRPGQPWQEALEEIIENTRSAAVLVGADGLGPWEDVEMRALLNEFVKRKLPVIPVLLPGCPKRPGLPLLLRSFTWVDLREGQEEEGFLRLLWGITGQKPELKPSEQPKPAIPIPPSQTEATKDQEDKGGQVTLISRLGVSWKPVIAAMLAGSIGVGYLFFQKIQNPYQEPEMVSLPGGEFWMGSDGDKDSEALPNEIPRQKVTVEPFSIGKYEVTRGQYAAFVADSHYAGSEDWKNPGFAQDDGHPVVNVSFEDAQAYADWLRQKSGKPYRLPTEAEWEYAARAGTETSRYWGNVLKDACSYANVYDRTAKVALNHGWEAADCRDGFIYTAPVGKFKPNGFELYDMLGNVSEWTCSAYIFRYDGSESRCGEGNDSRVMRGGSWGGLGWDVRSAYRNKFGPDYRLYSFGFRLALGPSHR